MNELVSDPLAEASFIWRAYEGGAMAIGLGSLAVICICWLPFAWLLHPALPARVGARIGRLGIMLGFRLYLTILRVACACRFDLSELDAIKNESGLIIAANHPSLLDAVLILSRLPNAVCIMKASLMNRWLFGSAARLAQYIPNHHAFGLMKKTQQALASGRQLLIFPEGTRTSRFPVNDFHPLLGLMSKTSACPVQTVFFDHDSPAGPGKPYLGKQWPLFRRPRLPLTVCLRLGKRFPAASEAESFNLTVERYFVDNLSRRT